MFQTASNNMTNNKTKFQIVILIWITICSCRQSNSSNREIVEMQTHSVTESQQNLIDWKLVHSIKLLNKELIAIENESREQLIISFLDCSRLKENGFNSDVIANIVLLDSIVQPILGQCTVFRIDLDENKIPNAQSKIMHFVVSSKLSTAYCIDIQKFYKYYSNNSDTCFISGVFINTKSRLGWYNIFSVIDGELKSCYNSFNELHGMNYPVYINSLCSQALNDYLDFQNEDINNDGTRDIRFSGQVKLLCIPEVRSGENNNAVDVKYQLVKLDIKVLISNDYRKFLFTLADTTSKAAISRIYEYSIPINK